MMISPWVFRLVVVSVLFLMGCSTSSYGQARNVILLIGDGMGPEQVRAAGMYAYGEAGTLVFEDFPCQTRMTTFSADHKVTDSAAASTAMATGRKVNNGVISIAVPGDKSDIPTLLEKSKAMKKSVGLVTTVPITDATPAGFGAHDISRQSDWEIARDYLERSRPEVLMGGGSIGMSKVAADSSGYDIFWTAQAMRNLDTEKEAERVCGLFGAEIPYESEGVGDLPHLSQMTETAVRILNKDPDGFFLMVEGGKIDKGCHDNNLQRAIGEVLEFERAVRIVLNWAKNREDTLIVVTADHETGGLKVVKNNGVWNYPTVRWSTKGHSSEKVSVYAWGDQAERFVGPMDNTDIHKFILEAIKPAKAESK
jgi:alkaline phosphatase